MRPRELVTERHITKTALTELNKELRKFKINSYDKASARVRSLPTSNCLKKVPFQGPLSIYKYTAL